MTIFDTDGIAMLNSKCVYHLVFRSVLKMADASKADPKDIKLRSDAFWLTDLYPDAAGLFQHEQEKLENITSDCVVILDANVLLWLFELGAASVDEVAKVYGKLSLEKRLVVPGQAAREYYRHRSNKVALVVENLDGAISRAKRSPLDAVIPLLNNDKDYETARRLNSDIAKLGNEFATHLSIVTKRLREEVGNDRVSQIYRSVLSSCVVDIPLENTDRQKIIVEAERRAQLKVAPGYKDQNKDDGGVGDLIIWFTVLQVGSERKSHCIFVTNEEKADWWIKSRGAFQPRPELIDEYRRASDGKSIHLLPLSVLLSSFKAEMRTVKEVQNLEVQHRSQRFSTSDFMLNKLNPLQLLNQVKLDTALARRKVAVRNNEELDNRIKNLESREEASLVDNERLLLIKELGRLNEERRDLRRTIDDMEQIIAHYQDLSG